VCKKFRASHPIIFIVPGSICEEIFGKVPES
jgi:hypothetical protein